MECKEEKKKERKHTNRVISVYIHCPTQAIVTIRRCEGWVPDLVLALVEQNIGSIGLKAETRTDRIRWLLLLLYVMFSLMNVTKL